MEELMGRRLTSTVLTSDRASSTSTAFFCGTLYVVKQRKTRSSLHYPKKYPGAEGGQRRWVQSAHFDTDILCSSFLRNCALISLAKETCTASWDTVSVHTMGATCGALL
jgi:hypothetical protein